VEAVAPLREISRAGAGPARVHVYAALRQAIVRGELEPGRRLSENELAGELGVSRTPVREALARLRDDGLVNVVPQLGTFVSPISSQAVGDAQFIREALECAAVRRAAERATEEDVATLHENLESQERAKAASDYEAFYALDDDFHRTLCDLSSHPTVWRVTERAKSHLNRVRRLSLGLPNYLPQMIEEHRAVGAAVAEANADEAEDRLRHHLRMVLREVPNLRAKYPSYFVDG
jgi:DNA-binding GntR family transcriptional regulator